MTVKLTKDDLGPPLEKCCFCRAKTAYWSQPKDVAVCPSCSENHDEKDVPSKEEWCEKENMLEKHKTW